MSYEKVRIVRVSERKDEGTGEVRTYVEFEQLVSARLRLDRAMHLKPEFDRLIGKEALVPMRAGVFEGRPFWTLDGDGKAIPVPEDLAKSDKPGSYMKAVGQS